MKTSAFYITTRGIRTLHHRQHRAPYPFVYRGSSGHKTTGPVYEEKYDFPVEQFPELSTKMRTKIERRTGYFKPNPSALHNHTNVQPPGYVNPRSGEFIVEDEMIPEIIAPDLTGCELKPYVSYRADAEIDKMEAAILRAKVQPGKSEPVDWPPEPETAERLFDEIYKAEVKRKFQDGFYDDENTNNDGTWKSALVQDSDSLPRK